MADRLDKLAKRSAEFIASDGFLRTRKWQSFAMGIKRRDGYECQECKRYGRHNGNQLIVHHIKPREEHPELTYDASNCITLCIGCHNKRHPEKGRRHGGRRNEMGYWQD